MPYVTILDFTEGRVIIQEYDDSVVDVEQEIILPLMGSSNETQYMCTEKLVLTINSKNDE